MPRTTVNGLRKHTARSKRRRSSTVTKAKFKPRTVRNNRKLIISNAKAISMLRKMQGPPVYTDYQYNNEFQIVSSPGVAQTDVFCDTLSSPVLWKQCLRTDDNVLDSSSTYWRNMTINVRVNLGFADYAQWSIFVITPRRDNNAFSFDPADFVEPRQYVLGPESMNPVLNSAQFKCHLVKHISLTNNAWKQQIAQFGPDSSPTYAAGNPGTTFRKFAINIRCKARLRNPQVSAGPVGSNKWKDMVDDELPYYQRYHILAIVRSETTLNVAMGTPTCSCNWHQVNTCINDN